MSGDAAWWEQTCEYWYAQAAEARQFRDRAILRANHAEAERDALRAQVEQVRALADECDADLTPQDIRDALDPQ